jgi:hypothetical protein
MEQSHLAFGGCTKRAEDPLVSKRSNALGARARLNGPAVGSCRQAMAALSLHPTQREASAATRSAHLHTQISGQPLAAVGSRRQLRAALISQSGSIRVTRVLCDWPAYLEAWHRDNSTNCAKARTHNQSSQSKSDNHQRDHLFINVIVHSSAYLTAPQTLV